MDRYPPQNGSALRYPPHGGGHGAERRWQPREARAGQEPRSFLSNARASARVLIPLAWCEYCDQDAPVTRCPECGWDMCANCERCNPCIYLELPDDEARP